MLLKSIYIFLFIVCSASLYGCEQSSVVRQYDETVPLADVMPAEPMTPTQPFLDNMPQDDIHANIKPKDMMPQTPPKSNNQQALRWQTPSAWNETRGQGMRVVTFNNKETQNPIEVSIVTLGKHAGGLEANVIRWINQLGQPAPDANTLGTFLDRQMRLPIATGESALLIDLTQWPTDNPSSDAEQPSMLTAIIAADQSQIFVKMTGSKAAVIREQAAFQSLVESISINK